MSESQDKKLSGVEMTADPQPELGETQKIDARQADEAAKYLNSTEQYEPLSSKEEKQMVRKTDWILLPMVSYEPCC